MICHLQRLALYWFHTPNCNWTKFRSQRTSHMEPSATSTTVTEPVGEHLQPGTEDATVLDRPAPLRRLHNSGAGYKCPDWLTYLQRDRQMDGQTDTNSNTGVQTCECYNEEHVILTSRAARMMVAICDRSPHSARNVSVKDWRNTREKSV